MKQKIEESLSILETLGFPRAQRNERSALCLLAILHLTQEKPWSQAENPLLGITPIMDFIKQHYQKQYAPNTRETFRRQTIHQFVQAGLVLYNPDDPGRATNSPKAVYQIEPSALELMRTYGTPSWATQVELYLSNRNTLVERYAKIRKQTLIPVRIQSETEIQLSPGRHSELIKQVIDSFAPRYAPNGILIYVGDTGKKWRYFDKNQLERFGVRINHHEKMPDVILYAEEKNWLFLIECVTSHGPIDAKRYEELKTLFGSATPGLVYITAFPSRTIMNRYLPEISWETEVWLADSPSHLIHFNGTRFLGPY